MTRAPLGAAVLLLLVVSPVLAAPGPSDRAAAVGPHLRHDRDTVSVRFAPGVSAEEADRIAATHGLVPVGRLDALGVRQYRAAARAGRGLGELRRDKRVRYAQPAHVVHATAAPNDPGLRDQWGLTAIRAPAAWSTTVGTFAAIIAIVDTGVASAHPEIVGKVLPGYDFVDRDTNADDPNGHGTFVAGIASAQTNNATGIAGVAGGSRILPLRALDANGDGTDQIVAEAVVYAADRGARVINLSLGGPDASLILQDAVDYANRRGAVVVAASGNDSTTTVDWPARYGPVIAVGAVQESGPFAIAPFSNRGQNLDVVAPGEAILSTLPGGYGLGDGTSFAAPFATGVAALLLGRDPTLTPVQVAARLRATAKDLGTPGYDTTFGAGLVDASSAVLATPKAHPGDTKAPVVRFTGAVQPGIVVRGTVTVAAQATDAGEVSQLELAHGGRIRAFAHPLPVADARTVTLTAPWATGGSGDGLRTWIAPTQDPAGNIGRGTLTVLVANQHATSTISSRVVTGAAWTSTFRGVRTVRATPFVARVMGPGNVTVTLALLRGDGSVVATAAGVGGASLAIASVPAGTYRLRARTSLGGSSISLTAGWYR
jgi:hypothetical protein